MSGLSRDEAKDQLLSALNNELQQESGALILKHEKQVAERCEERTREILITAIQRYAAAHTADTTISTVDIPSDEMKGRIIGREGRNIRAFEKATGVDVIVDDTPGVVIVSAFDTGAPRDRPAVAGEADRRRADSPLADRGDRQGNRSRDGAASSARSARRPPRRPTCRACTRRSSNCSAG